MLQSALPATTGRRRLGRRESVALLAALMSLNAIGIDAMVPALPQIAHGLGITNPNQQQLIIITYLLGFGAGQLFWGPLADRFGRRPLLVAGLLLFALFTLGCALAPSFALLIAARVAMGAAAASTRVLVTAIIRDLFEGEAMAKVMSLVFMVFMVIPVLAPSLGEAILMVGEWRTIFLVIMGYSALLLCWSLARLPETLHPEDQRSIDPRSVLEAVRLVVGDRLAIGYTLASTALFGALSAYIATIQQIVADVFDATRLLPLVFAAVAAPMAAAAFTNSRIVGRFGLRRVGHAGLIGFLVIAVGHWLAQGAGFESLGLFMLLQGSGLVAFALCSANFGTLAMTNMAAFAGTASSIQGVTGTIGGALIGFAIGQAFHGTLAPFLGGSALAALAALVIALATERGRLFAAIAPGTA
ncbi:MAG: multidrug effflux MFS transporter [Sphingomicrobium sp.]